MSIYQQLTGVDLNLDEVLGAVYRQRRLADGADAEGQEGTAL